MRAATCAVLVACLAGVTAGAQAPDGSDRLGATAAAESLKVLKQLDLEVNKRSDDATLWYRRGMIAWVLLERSRHLPKVRGLDWTSLSPKADQSLRKAFDLDDDNETYFFSLARFILAKDGAFMPFRGAYRVFGEAVKAAVESGDPQRIAVATTEQARLYWLRYDRSRCLALDGEIEYLMAEMLLHQAREAAPSDTLIFRRLVALLIETERWVEVATLARTQIERVPSDPWAWMSLGMALQRAGRGVHAVAVFDTAMRAFPEAERARIFRFERVLGTGDRRRWDSLSAEQRRATEAFYWRSNDPVWTIEGTEPQTEFLARLTFASLRWASDEIGLDGFNTDNGNHYIRTGTRDPTAGCLNRRVAWYLAKDTTVLNGVPGRWRSLSAGLRVDTMPTQFARFRAPGDSTDVYLGALPPIDAIRRSSQVREPIRTDFWIVATGMADVVHDSTLDSRAGARGFTGRLAPGSYVYRAEASARSAPMAARATAGFIAGTDARTGYSTSGFGMSDVLVAVRAEPRGSTPQRWSDFDIVPLTASVARGSDIALVWENYDFASDSGSTKYGVTITLRRLPDPPAVAGRGGRRGGIVAPPRVNASIISRLASAIGINRTDDAIEFKFDRAAAHAPVIVDNIQVSLRETPQGTYLLSLQIVDQVTGRNVGRSQRIAITEQRR